MRVHSSVVMVIVLEGMSNNYVVIELAIALVKRLSCRFDEVVEVIAV